MIDSGRYTSGRIALANLSASIGPLERRRIAGSRFEDLAALSGLLFVRGDLLGRIADHDRAELVAIEAITLAPARAPALYLHAQLAGRFHRFKDAGALLDQALAAGQPKEDIDAERASLLQATGRYREALGIREIAARERRSIRTLGSLASLLDEMDRPAEADALYDAALEADDGPSPIPAAMLLFERAVGAMRRADLDRAEAIFAQLQLIMPQHVPARGHRAEVALARGDLDAGAALVEPLLEISDDPEYRALHAQILAARGDPGADAEARRAAGAYDALLARRPEAYADHAAAFFMGIGNRPQRSVDLAWANRELRDTPRARRLLAAALRSNHPHSGARPS